MPLCDVLSDRHELGTLVLIDQIRLVDSLHRLIGRDRDHAKFVDLKELRCFGHRSTGHTAQLVVEPEVILECDGGKGLVLILDRHSLFRFQGLMETFVVTTSCEDATGMFIDNQ